ncbi:hypothetical protein [Dehalobacter sp. MCB1]|uniref:hypothetical protein n=1 Tax=Dehalobacter sp. MCB1 TaxID=1844756 RepID=UPI001314FE10|nr:hypothetical protein [Dehalobacter sp. MCB1]
MHAAVTSVKRGIECAAQQIALRRVQSAKSSMVACRPDPDEWQDNDRNMIEKN